MGVWYEDLRIAIIKQAVHDYKKALRTNDAREVRNIERFFLGEWGQLLSGNKGEYIIAECQRRVNLRR